MNKKQTLNKKLLTWVISLIILVIIGAWGAYNTLCVPGTENLSNLVPWGLGVVVYIFFVLCTTGLCVLSAMASVFKIKPLVPLKRRILYLATITLVVGLILIAIDAGKPLRATGILSGHINLASPMLWLTMCYGGYLIFLLIEDFIEFTGAFKKFLAPAGIIAVVLAISAHSTMGALFSVLDARILWSSVEVYEPIFFIVSAIVSGLGVLIFTTTGILYLKDLDQDLRMDYRASLDFLRKMLLVMIVVEGFFITWHSIVAANSSAMKMILFGDFAPLFWIFEVLFGLAVPFALLISPKFGNTKSALLSSSFLTLIGLFVVRYNLVIGGMVRPLPGIALKGLSHVPYVPSLYESLLVVFGFALVILLATLCERFLPTDSEKKLLREAP